MSEFSANCRDAKWVIVADSHVLMVSSHFAMFAGKTSTTPSLDFADGNSIGLRSKGLPIGVAVLAVHWFIGGIAIVFPARGPKVGFHVVLVWGTELLLSLSIISILSRFPLGIW